MAETAWRPTPEYVENANVTRFMRHHGIGSIDEFRRRSIEDMEWFWDAVVQDMSVEFTATLSASAPTGWRSCRSSRMASRAPTRMRS
jgi:hypothetical protein